MWNLSQPGRVQVIPRRILWSPMPLQEILMQGLLHPTWYLSYCIVQIKYSLLLGTRSGRRKKELVFKAQCQGFWQKWCLSCSPQADSAFHPEAEQYHSTGWLHQLFVDQTRRSGCSKMRSTTKPWMNGKSQSYSLSMPGDDGRDRNTTVVQISLPSDGDAGKAYRITSLATICC